MVYVNCCRLSILKDLGIEYVEPMDIHCYNKVGIGIMKDLIQHNRSKHVEVGQCFIRENLDQKIIQFSFIALECQLANVLTKAL